MTGIALLVLLFVSVLLSSTRAQRRQPVGGRQYRVLRVEADQVPDLALHAGRCAGFRPAGYLAIGLSGEFPAGVAPRTTSIAVLLAEDRTTALTITAHDDEPSPFVVLVSWLVDGRQAVTSSGPRSVFEPPPDVSVRRAPGVSLRRLQRVHAAHVASIRGDVATLDPTEVLALVEQSESAKTDQRLARGELADRDGWAHYPWRLALREVVYTFEHAFRARATPALVLGAVGLSGSTLVLVLVPLLDREWIFFGWLVALSLAGSLVLRDYCTRNMYGILAVTSLPFAWSGELFWFAPLVAQCAAVFASAPFSRPMARAPVGGRAEPRGTRKDMLLTTLGPACALVGLTLGAALFVFMATPRDRVSWPEALGQLMVTPSGFLLIALLGVGLVLLNRLPRDHTGRRVYLGLVWLPALALAGLTQGGWFAAETLQETRDSARTITSALERHRAAHDAYPAALEALVPETLASVPSSTIGWHREPFRYERTVDGYELSHRSPTGRRYYVVPPPVVGAGPRSAP